MSESSNSADSSPLLILVVDDDEDIRNLFEHVLGDGGFQVITAINGHDALMKVEHQKPHLVLLDVMLPDVSGLEVLQLIRQMPVIMVTARSEKSLTASDAESGMTEYLIKPFTPAVLLRHATSILARFRHPE
jgi:two-component system alkaline phosphatase synthesis response regulator PhoP